MYNVHALLSFLFAVYSTGPPHTTASYVHAPSLQLHIYITSSLSAFCTVHTHLGHSSCKDIQLKNQSKWQSLINDKKHMFIVCKRIEESKDDFTMKRLKRLKRVKDIIKHCVEPISFSQPIKLVLNFFKITNKSIIFISKICLLIFKKY